MFRWAPIRDIPGVAELPILRLCKSQEKNSRINRDFRDNKLVATAFVALALCLKISRFPSRCFWELQSDVVL